MINKIKGNFVLKSTILVTATSLFSNVFAYGFQLLSGRALSVSEYGVLVALISLHNIFTLPTGIVANAITKIVTEVKDDNYPDGLSNLYYSLFKFNVFFSLAVVLLLVVSKNFLLEYLRIDFTRVFVPFVTYVFLTLVISQNRSFLQALKRFKAYSLVAFFTNFFKFLSALLVYFLNLGLFATFSFLSAFTFLTGLGGYILLRKNVNNNFKGFAKNNINKILKFSAASSLAFLGVNFMQNNDIILVKHFFSGDVAGYYSSAAVIGKIIFYGISPIAVVFFPICAEKYFKGENYISPMFKALSVSAGLASIGALIFYFSPNLIVSVLFGQKYIEAIQFLPYYSIYILFYTVFAIFTWLLVSISKLKLASISVVLALMQYASVKLFFHDSPVQILTVFTVYVFIGLVVYILFMFKDINKFVLKRGN